MDIQDSEFVYTFIKADGSVADVRQRFRVPSDYAIRLHEDGAILTHLMILKPDTKIILPKPTKELPFFDKTAWESITTKPDETLKDLLKRAHKEDPKLRRRLFRDPTAPSTAEYAWHHWRNADVRGAVLNGGASPAEKDILALPTGDPSKVQFKGGEDFFLPVTPVTQHEVPVTPGTPGGTAPTATVDVSSSDLDSLRKLFATINDTLDRIRGNRETASATHLKCQRLLGQLCMLQSLVTQKDRAITDAAARANASDLNGYQPKRANFIAALSTLIGKAAPLLLAPAAVEKFHSTLATDFRTELGALHTLITKRDNLALIAKVIPAQGNMPLFAETQPGQATVHFESLIERLCDLAASSAYWMADAGSGAQAKELIGAAMDAMIASKVPSAGATSIIDYAVGIPFFPAGPAAVMNFTGTLKPQAACGAVCLLHVCLCIAEAIEKGDSSTSSSAFEKLADAQGSVLAKHGWTSWASDVKALAKGAGAAAKPFTEAYAPVALGAGLRTEAVEAEGIKPALRAAMAVNAEKGLFASARLGIEAKRTFGEEKMKEAFAACELMDHPAGKLAGREFNNADSVFGRTGSLIRLGFLVGGLGGNLKEAIGGEDPLARAQAGLELIEGTIGALKKLKIFSSVETGWVGMMAGRVAAVLGVALDLVAAQKADAGGDWQGALAHGASAAGSMVCFLAMGLAPPLGVIFVAVGVVLIVGGNAPSVIAALTTTEVGTTFAAVFPSEHVSVTTFEGECVMKFSLVRELAAVKAAFVDQSFEFVVPRAHGFGAMDSL